MLKEYRKEELLQRIERAGYISVEELSRQLFISQSTVRRNLTELEQAGFVRRTHGGVEIFDESYHAPLLLRMKMHHPEKRRIAKQAAQRIRDDSVIFMGGSSTCLYMVPFLQKKRNITIYTNGVELCSVLSETNIPVCCLGGMLLPRSRAFSGDIAISMAQTMYFDALFFSCGGMDGDIVTDYSQPEACLRRVLLAQSKEKYLLCDSSKIGKTYPYILCSRTELTDVFTDNAAEND